MNVRPKVGLGLLITKGDKILLGRRKGSHGDNEWGGPGGHMEHDESFEDSILREAAEEIGPQVKLKNIRFLCVTNLRKYLPKHYVDIGMTAEWVSGEPTVMEPEKCFEWCWFALNKLPDNLFGCTLNYIESHKSGRAYFDK